MEAMRQMAAVAGVLTVLAGTLWWLRRRGFAGVLPARRQAAPKLECLERLPLGPQHTLHLVRLGGKGLLVASWPGGCALVGSFSSSEVESPWGVAR
jgi:flagellar biogenesis protein FliO